MKCFLKALGQIQFAEVPSVCLEIRFFLTHLLGYQLRPSPYILLSRHTRFPHASQMALEQRKEMTFDRRLANISDAVLVFQGLYCPFSENMMKKALRNHGK